MSKERWKQKMLENFRRYYGDFSEADQTEISNLLDKHWRLNQEKGARVIGHFAGILSIGLSTTVDLSAFLPSGPLAAVVGRSAFMALSYVLGDELTSQGFSKVLPALEGLDDQHLKKLREIATDVQSLIGTLRNINKDIEIALNKETNVTKLGAIGVFTGSLIHNAFLGDLASTHGVTGAAAVGARGVPMLKYGLDAHASVPTTWEKSLVSGLRHRSPRSTNG